MKRFIRLVLFAAVLCVLFMICSGAAALEKSRCYKVEEYYNGSYFYEVSSLPEWVKPYNDTCMYHLVNKNSESEPAERITVKYISGDQELADALLSNDSNPDRLGINGMNAIKSGKVTYSIHMESEHYYADEKVAVNVVPYEEMPLFTEEVKSIVIDAKIGQVLNSTEILQEYLPLAEDIDVSYSMFSTATGHEEYYFSGIGFPGLDFTFNDECTVTANGIYDLYINTDVLRKGDHYINAGFVMPLRINCLNIDVVGPGMVSPGKSEQYVLSDPEKKVTWTVEGSGATIDEKGVLTADEGVPFATVQVIARIEGEETEIAKEVVIGSNLFVDLDGSVTTSEGGFICPVFEGDSPNPEGSPVISWHDLLFEDPLYDYARLDAYLDNHFSFSMQFSVYPNGMTVDSAETGREYLEKVQPEWEKSVKTYMNAKDVKSQIEKINGHPMLFITYADTNFYGYENNGLEGMLIYPRNGLCLQIIFNTSHGNSLIPDLLDVMRAYAAIIQYDKEFEENVKRAGIRITNAKPVYVTSGKSFALNITGEDDEAMAEFVKRPDFDLESNVYNNLQTKERSQYAGVKNLTIITAKGLEKPVSQVVEIRLLPFGSTDTLEFTIIPPATKVTAEPAKLTLYAGSDQPATVSAEVLPENIPPAALSWSSGKKDIIELTDNGDGTAAVKALKAGQDTLTVAEPGGKKAAIKVSVVAPVESIELAVKGKAVPGGTVTVKETLTPKNAGNKTVEWSLDVDESIATVNKGKVKVAKDVPAGTVITVTCTALGAPEPVSASAVITTE